MNPLDAAQQIIDARARATMGEWKHGRDISHFDAPEVVTDRYSAHIPVLEDAELIALSANHAAAVAQAYIDAMQDNARLRAALVKAREAIEDWGEYALDTFGSKQGLIDDLAAIDAAMEDAR